MRMNPIQINNKIPKGRLLSPTSAPYFLVVLRFIIGQFASGEWSEGNTAGFYSCSVTSFLPHYGLLF